MDHTSTAFVVTSTASWAEVTSILTFLLIFVFGVWTWVVPRGVKMALQWSGNWPVKVLVKSARIDEPERRLFVTYEIRPRIFTVTERHSPRVHEVDVIITGATGQLSERLTYQLSLHLDEIYEGDWGRVRRQNKWDKREPLKRATWTLTGSGSSQICQPPFG